MSINKELKVTGFIIRAEENLKRDDLTRAEQLQLAINLNRMAMEAAGYTPVAKTKPNISNSR